MEVMQRMSDFMRTCVGSTTRLGTWLHSGPM